MNNSIPLCPTRAQKIPCKVSDITELNQTKEYTAMASYLLEHALTDQQLTGQAAKLWQLLFSRAKFDKKLSITVSQQYLSTLMGRSVRQIQRYINDLLAHGYLVLRQNYREDKGQVSNTYYVRAPSDLVAINKAQRDRRSVDITPTSPSTDCLTGWDKLAQQSALKVDADENVALPPDKLVTHNNNSYSSFLINNNNKGSISETIEVPTTTEKPSVVDATIILQKEIMATSASLQQAYTTLHTKAWGNEMEKYDFDRQVIGRLVGQETLLKHRLDQLLKQDKKNEKEKEKKEFFVKHPNAVALIKGDRAISASDFTYLENQLQQVKLKPQENKAILLNEICYEIRFGTLRQSKNKQSLSIRHAINIAIKLVREDRWQAPMGFLALTPSLSEVIKAPSMFHVEHGHHKRH